MTYVNLSAKRSFGLWDRLVATVAELKAAQRRRAVYARTFRELNALTERELSDLGIAQIQIADVAREAAYGTK